jgi:ABC-type multidrug transport system ATPase subunit
MSIAGILNYEGRVLLDGREIRSMPLERRGITYAPARPSLINSASVLDNLKMSGNEALEIAERLNLRSVLPVKAGGLNEGARKLVQIAMALGSGSLVVLIDEPFAFLSLQNSKLVLDEIAMAREKIIVITSHERLEGFTSYIDMEKYKIKG